VPFSCVKNVLRIAFFCPKALLKTWIYVIVLKIFFISGKIWYISGKYDMSPPPRRQLFREKIIGELFYSESAPQSLPPPTFRSFLRPLYLTLQTSRSVNNSQGVNVNIICFPLWNTSSWDNVPVSRYFRCSVKFTNSGRGVANVREVGIPPNKSYLASLWTRLWCLSIFTSARELQSNNLNTLHCYAMQYTTLQKISNTMLYWTPPIYRRVFTKSTSTKIIANYIRSHKYTKF
jgi:hypothetical protein